MQFREAIAIITGGRMGGLCPAALAVGPAGTRVVIWSRNVPPTGSPVAAILDALGKMLPTSFSCGGPAQPVDGISQDH